MNKKVVSSFVGIAVVLAGVLIFIWRGRAVESTDDAAIDADVVRVVSPTAGRITLANAHEHAHVRRGDVLFQLDDRALRAKLDAAEADRAEAESEAKAAALESDAARMTAPGTDTALRAALSGSATEVDSAHAEALRAESAVARASADADLARLRLERARALTEAGAAAPASLDEAENEAKRADATLAEARGNADATRAHARAARTHVDEARGRLAETAPAATRVALATAKREAADARVAAAKAAVANARAGLDDACIRAPADGQLANVSAFTGGAVSAGEPLAVLVPAPFYVTANFKETQIAAVHEGMTVEVEVDALADTPLRGKVESRAPGTGTRFSALHAENASGNFVKVTQRVPVRISLVDPPPPDLRAGLSATVNVRVR